MKISYKIMIGFVILIVLSISIGIFSIIQIQGIEGQLKSVATIGGKARDLEYHSTQMVHMTDLYWEGTSIGLTGNTRTTFLNHSASFNNILSEIELILPELSDELSQIRSNYSTINQLCLEENSGLFDLLDDIFNISKTVRSHYPGYIDEFNQLQAIETTADMILNATILEFLFEREVHLMHQYLQGIGIGKYGKTWTEFLDMGNDFDMSIFHLQLNSNNVTLVNQIDNHHDIFVDMIVRNSTGLFDLIDSATATREQIRSSWSVLSDILKTVDQSTINQVEASIIQAENIVQNAIIMILILLLLACFLGGIIGYFTINSVKKPITGLIDRTQKVAKGDLTVDLITKDEESWGGKDEINQLSEAFGSMVDSLKGLIGSTQESSNHLASSAEELAASSEEVNALSEEIAATIQQISRGATQQTEIAAAGIVDIEAMSKTVDQAMKDIENTLSIIAEVAEQTNILALNASIEAARAGEYGRGFAVVADNVRRLAEDTKNNATDIGVLTKNIVKNLSESVINITESFENFSAQSEEFSASSEEVAAATEEQTAAMNNMTASAQDLTRLSEELINLISRFDLS